MPADPSPRGPAAPEVTSYAHLDARQRFATVAGLMLTLLLAAMDQTIVGTAMPRVVSSLDGFDRYPWVTTAYLLTSSPLDSDYLLGWLGDTYALERDYESRWATLTFGVR